MVNVLQDQTLFGRRTNATMGNISKFGGLYVLITARSDNLPNYMPFCDHVMEKEAKARIKINRLLEHAGWRFFDDEK